MTNPEAIVLQSKFQWNQTQKNAWLEERQMALDYYNGETDNYTKKYFPDDCDYPLGRINITKRIINRISLVNMVPPLRYTGSKKEKSNDYYNLIKTKDFALQRLERLVNLLELVPVRIVWRNNQFEYDIILEFEPEFDDDPMKPIGIHYPIMNYSNVLNIREEVWTYVDEYQQYDYIKSTGKRITADDETNHGYGITPVVFCFRDGIPESGFLHTGITGDIIRINEGINVFETAKYGNGLYQSFGYGFLSGNSIPQDLKIGRDKWTLLDVEDRANMITPPDVLKSISETIIDDFKIISKTYHLSDSFVEGTAAESGVALRLRNQELTDDRKSDVTRWREYENQIYEIEKKIGKVHGKNFPDEFSVDYQESIEVLSPKEQREKWEWELSNGFKDKADILVEMNPDRFPGDDEKTPREQAQEYLAKRIPAAVPGGLLNNLLNNE